MTIKQRTNLADELIGLGEHLRTHPDLPRIYAILPSPLDRHLSVRLLNAAPEALREWASTLRDVTGCYAYRYEDHVDGHLVGAMEGGLTLELVGSLNSDMFPAEKGRYEWDVAAEGGVSS